MQEVVWNEGWGTQEVWQAEEQQGIEGRHFLSCRVSFLEVPLFPEQGPA